VAAKGYAARPKIVLVEGTTDFDLLELAGRLEHRSTGVNVLADLAFVPAGHGSEGGTNAVIREMIAFRAFASTVLDPTGRPVYRICALLDSDKAGLQALKTLRQIDIGIVEYRDVFLLSPEMPATTNRDPGFIARLVQTANEQYKGIDWEIEDLLPIPFIVAFEQEYRTGIYRKSEKNGKQHHDFNADGKARFHRFVKLNAMAADLCNVVAMIRSLRSYLGLR
jgi:hypothetical protein